MNYPSKFIENAIDEISKLPGIGKKSALRLALHLLKADESKTMALSQALIDLRTKTTFCRQCHNISDDELCQICTSINRDEQIICVVQDTRDVLAIENTAQYQGQYHVLGGIISPIAGIGPNDLNIDTLMKRISESGQVKEIILALSPTMEGDTTAFYLQKKLTDFNLHITTIARGIPIGGDLEYADEITLGRSIASRTRSDLQ
ncbi:recombination mediator RecR [uncultured Arcticibacterium sp.]|uniref:recombination mediator RecR n=1 Tax=uncultured Arcticibacterium sp. TaxID=2173042 RepID=UPI0030FB5C50